MLALNLGFMGDGKGAWDSDDFTLLSQSIQLSVLSEEWSVAAMLAGRLQESNWSGHSAWHEAEFLRSMRSLMSLHSAGGAKNPWENSFHGLLFEWWLDFYQQDMHFGPDLDKDEICVMLEMSGMRRPFKITIEHGLRTITIQDVQKKLQLDVQKTGGDVGDDGEDTQPIVKVVQVQLNLHDERKLRISIQSPVYPDTLNLIFPNRDLKDRFHALISNLKHEVDPDACLLRELNSLNEADLDLEVTVDYQKVLGAGATATVYQGKNVETGEMVAVKVFNGSNDDDEFKAMEAEVALMKKLRHDNIVRF